MKNKKYKLKVGKSPPGFEDLEVLLDIFDFLKEKRARLLEPIRRELGIIDKEIKNVKQKIKNLALQKIEKTTKVKNYKLIYCKGRTSWNTKTLDYLARENDDIKKCRIESKPWIRIKEAQNGKNKGCNV